MKTDNVTTNIISKAFEKWADKIWFQIIIAILIIYLMAAPIVGPIIYNYINKTNTTEAVVQGIEAQHAQEREQHKLDFERSKQAYASTKKIMNDYLIPSGVEYIFLIEFHNGVDNVMTGIQFCRFDITLEVVRDNYPYVNNEKFKNDIVARYDVLLNEEISNSSRVFYYTVDDLHHVDKYLEQQIRYLEAKSCAFVNVTDKQGNTCGMLLFVSMDKNIDCTQVYNCQRDVERNLKTRP